MSKHAKGSFDVKLTPLHAEGEAQTPGRVKIDKQYHGDLTAVSQGQMLSVMGSVQGSAGYVAMEVVIGTLGGRSGTFVLQHSGTMNRGQAELMVMVVPDSGTEELSSISGNMVIRVEPGGKHFYEFDYVLEV